MAENCCACEAQSVLVFACSGGSNVGQRANAAAVEIARQGQAKMYFLEGLGGDVSGMIDSGKHVDYRIVIDGCPVACTRKTLERVGVTVDHGVVATALGIAKNGHLARDAAEVARIVEAATETTAGTAPRPRVGATVDVVARVSRREGGAP